NATFDLYYQHAYAMPRQVGTTSSSTFTFNYSASGGKLSTTWTLNTVALKPGASTDSIQGWLPQDYEDMLTGPSLLSGITYASTNGPMKVSLGNSFTIQQSSTGIAYL